MAAFTNDFVLSANDRLGLGHQGGLERLAQLVALEAMEQSLFDDPIAQKMPPTWASLLTLGSERHGMNGSFRSRTRVAEPFKSPVSIILSEVDSVWDRYRQSELPLDIIALRTRQVVDTRHERSWTGTLQDWLPACVSHVLPTPRKTKGYIFV